MARLGCCRQRPLRMTTRERLFLTPIEKLLKYRVFPWKLLLNASLVVLVTSNVVIMNSQTSAYFQAAERNFYGLFFPDGFDFGDRTDQVATIGDAVDAVQRAVDSYYTINDATFDVYQYTLVTQDDGSQAPSPPLLTVEAFTGDNLFVAGENPSPATATTTYVLNQTYLGPIDPVTVPFDDIQQFFHRLVSMQLTLPVLKNFAFGSLYRSCFQWAITITYDFKDRGQLQLIMDQAVVGTCDEYASPWDAYAQKLLWLNIVIIVLALGDIALLVKASLRSFVLMRRLQAWAQRQARLLAGQAIGVDDDAVDLASQFRHSADSSKKHVVTGAAIGGGNSSGSLASQDREPLLAADHLAANLSKHSTKAAATGAVPHHQTSPPLPQLLFSYNNTLDTDGGGDIYVTAELPAGADGRKQRVVFAPGADGEQGAVLEVEAVGGDGRSEQIEDVVVGGTGEGDGRGAVDGEEWRSQREKAAEKRNRVVAAAAALALQSAWAGLTWRDRFRFINGWAVLALLADLCNIAAAALNLESRLGAIPTATGHALVLGFGLVFLWLGVLRYLEHNRTYFNIVLTLRRTAPRVLRFLVGVAPIFLAYALFAVVMFSDRIPRFVNLTTSCITLFANLNGDVIRETVMGVVAYYPVVGMIFYFTFIPLMIYVVLNIVLATVEEAYFVTVAKTSELRERIDEEQRRAWDAALQSSGGGAPAPPAGSGSGGSTAKGVAAASFSSGGNDKPGLLPLFEALPASVDPLITSARADSNSVKLRPGSSFATVLRLSEWEELAAAGRGDASPLKLSGKAPGLN